jgi:selenocysteine lyase/cysteine desulfurase
MAGLREIPRIEVYGPAEATRRIAVVSFNIAGLTSAEVAQELDERLALMSRPGLHCAPAAHRAIGTFPQGTVRFSFGPFTKEPEIDAALEALGTLARGG